MNSVRPSDLKLPHKLNDQSQTIGSTDKVIPVPLPRLNSSSSNDSTPQTPVPLPRTKFNIITAESTALERSVSVPSSKPHYEEKSKLTHSVSDPSNWRHLKKVPDSALPSKVLEEETEVNDEGDTWL